MKHSTFLALFGLSLLAVSCVPEFDILDNRVPDPLDNINNPLRLSDADYAVVSQELDIDQDIFMPLHLSESDKQALVDFLEMTADRAILTADHLSNPFRE